MFSFITYFIIYVSWQTSWLWTLSDSLWGRGLSSEVQPLPSDRAGDVGKQSAGFRREAAVWSCGESTLCSGDSEVSRKLESVPAGFSSIVLNTISVKAKIQYFLLSSVKLWEENGDRLQDWTERQRERTVSQSDEPEACCDHVFELMWRRLLLLCSCLQEIKLDYSWQHYKMYRDRGPHSSNCCSIKSDLKLFVLSCQH